MARAVRHLDEGVRVVGFVGGPQAPAIGAACTDMGIEQHWVSTAEESRTCLIVVDPNANVETVVNEPGPHVTQAEVDKLSAAVRACLGEGDMLCISGSAPPGVPSDFYADVLIAARHKHVRVLADVSGALLREMWTFGVWALAPNQAESREALGFGDVPEDVARHLSSGADHVLLTLGASGVIYGHCGAARHLFPPAVPTVNAVGSGDAFVAGFAVGIERGYEPLEAVRLAMACGASNAQHLEPGVGGSEEIERLMGGVTMREIRER